MCPRVHANIIELLFTTDHLLYLLIQRSKLILECMSIKYRTPSWLSLSRIGYVILMSFMELLCDASYNERKKKTTVTFSNLKEKNEKNIVIQILEHFSTGINRIIITTEIRNNPDLPLSLRGESGLLTTSAVVLKYRRSHSFCWICFFSRVHPPPPFLFSLKNYQALFNF